MKLLIGFLTFATLSISNISFADDVRDLSANPLTKTEAMALRASTSLAAELGKVVSPECVNASFTPGTTPVHVQFFVPADGADSAFCVDPHYSIRVHFTDSLTIHAMEVLDN